MLALKNKLPHGEQPYGEGPVALRLADSQQEIETLSPTACEEPNAGSNHVILETDLSPVKPQVRAQSWPTPRLQRTSLRLLTHKP